MRTFKDNTGRTWNVAINVDTIKRVRAMTDVNLLEILGGSVIERLVLDPILLCDVAYAVCKPEAEQRGVSDEDFGRAMAGDAIDEASRALLEDLVDFFPSPRDRANLRKVLEANQRAMDKARDLIEARLESGALDKEVDQMLKKAGASSGTAPASSESTQAP